jgi:hypothetical protein
MNHYIEVLWNKALIAYLRLMLQAFFWKFSEKSRKSSASVIGLRTQIWTRGPPKYDSGGLNLYCGFWCYCYSNMEVSSFLCLIWIPTNVKSGIAAWNLRCKVYSEHRNVGSRQIRENACLCYRPMWNSKYLINCTKCIIGNKLSTNSTRKIINRPSNSTLA